MLAVGEDWLAFARYTDREASIIAVNRGPDVVVLVPLGELPLTVEHWREAGGHAFEQTPGGLSFALPAADFRILMSERGKVDARLAHSPADES
jgi:alpha-glucosidase